MDIQARLLDRFLRYAAVESQSRAGCREVPSTPGQWDMARLLAEELEELGLRDVALSDACVVTARLPARLPEGHAPADPVGWVAHMDTVDAGLCSAIRPVLIRDYRGGDILRGEGKHAWIREEEHPYLARYVGQDILCSDGTSVLGADDKAAVASVMTALEALKEDPSIPHAEIYAAFVPDEEVGLRGAKSMDLSRFPVKYAYTIDCCALGEIVWQTFNAGSAVLSIEGVAAHPMSAKGKLVNPALAAADFVSMFDPARTPECTEGTQGYIWVTGISSDMARARVELNIRDHDKKKYEAKKHYIEKAADLLRLKYPRARVELKMEDVYGNIADAIPEGGGRCLDLLRRAFEEEGVEPVELAMRGGTDGSYLSVCGIPTPNYFTGAHNFHSADEFLPMGSFEKSCRVTIALMRLSAGD